MRIRSSQKFFTEDEVASLTGICHEHLRALVASRHLGMLVRAAQASAEQLERVFTRSDLFLLTMLFSPCQHGR